MKSYIFFIFLISGFIYGCSGSKIPVSPLKQLTTSIPADMPYTILLEDMDLQNNKFVHKYKLFKFRNSSSPAISTTDWLMVSEDFFKLHQNDFKMELLSRNMDGKYNNLVTPAGFTNVIGNEKYGFWADSSKLWIFLPKYKKLETELGIDSLPIYKGEYNVFKERHLFNKPFYGVKPTKDSTKYGTRSHFYMSRYGMFYGRYYRSQQFKKKGSKGSTRTYRGGGGFGK